MSHQLRLTGLFLVLSTCLLLSCQPDSEVVSDPEVVSASKEQYTVTFSVSNYQQISFDDLSRAETRTTSSNNSSPLERLLMVVYDAETGEQVRQPIQHNLEDYKDNNYAYGQFSVTLPYGHYRVLILGYSGKRACNIVSVNQISWEDDYVPNTFLYYGEYLLNEGTNITKEITLKHVVAAFHLKAEDATPSDLKKMRFLSSAGGTVLDATTGLTPQSTGRTSEIIVPDNVAKEGIYFTIYLFLPEEQITTNYTVQALGANDALLNEKLFNNVPLRINYLTQWQGKLFEPSDDMEQEGVQRGFSIEWDTKWEDTIIFNP